MCVVLALLVHIITNLCWVQWLDFFCFKSAEWLISKIASSRNSNKIFQLFFFSGLIYNGSWPIWSLDSWWIPLLTAIFGTLGNVLIVKMVLQQQQYSSFVIYIKVSLEVIALFILSNDNIERSPSNMASLGLFITCCIIVILYGRKV